MSNLSDLLPAGGGGKQVDFVASGTLGSGQTVVLNSNGTVSVVAETSTPQAIGTKTSYSSGQVVDQSVAYSPTSNKIVIIYSDYGASQYGRAVVGTVSGTSITFGTPVTFDSSYVSYNDVVFDSTFNKIIVAYQFQSGTYSGRTVIGTISGNSISFTSPVTFSSSSFFNGKIAIDSVNNKVVAVWSDQGNGHYGTARAGTFNGSTITWGTASIFQSNITFYQDLIYIPDNDKYLVSHYTPGGGLSSVITLSGTSLSFGSSSSFVTAGLPAYPKSLFNSANNKIVTVWLDLVNNTFYATLGTISGTSISYGTPIQFESDVYEFDATQDVGGNIYVPFAQLSSPYNGYFVVGSITGNSISFTTRTQFTTNIYQLASAYDSTSNKMVTSFRDNALTKGSAVVVQIGSTSTNNTSFIGITDQAIANGASGKVVVQGGVSEKVTGLTANTDYYVQSDGSISTTVSSVPAGKALSSTSILLKG